MNEDEIDCIVDYFFDTKKYIGVSCTPSSILNKETGKPLYYNVILFTTNSELIENKFIQINPEGEFIYKTQDEINEQIERNTFTDNEQNFNNSGSGTTDQGSEPEIQEGGGQRTDGSSV